MRHGAYRTRSLGPGAHLSWSSASSRWDDTSYFGVARRPRRGSRRPCSARKTSPTRKLSGMRSAAAADARRHFAVEPLCTTDCSTAERPFASCVLRERPVRASYTTLKSAFTGTFHSMLNYPGIPTAAPVGASTDNASDLTMKRNHLQRGASLPETVIVMGVLMFLLLGIIDFGRFSTRTRSSRRWRVRARAGLSCGAPTARMLGTGVAATFVAYDVRSRPFRGRDDREQYHRECLVNDDRLRRDPHRCAKLHGDGHGHLSVQVYVPVPPSAQYNMSSTLDDATGELTRTGAARRRASCSPLRADRAASRLRCRRGNSNRVGRASPPFSASSTTTAVAASRRMRCE